MNPGFPVAHLQGRTDANMFNVNKQIQEVILCDFTHNSTEWLSIMSMMKLGVSHSNASVVPFAHPQKCKA